MSVCWSRSRALWGRLHRLMRCLLKSVGACQATEVGGSMCWCVFRFFCARFRSLLLLATLSPGDAVRCAHVSTICSRRCKV